MTEATDKDAYLIDVIVDQHRRMRTQELTHTWQEPDDPDNVYQMISEEDMSLIDQECAELKAKGERDGWQSIAVARYRVNS